MLFVRIVRLGVAMSQKGAGASPRAKIVIASIVGAMFIAGAIVNAVSPHRPTKDPPSEAQQQQPSPPTDPICGRKPKQSGWSGMVYAAEGYIKEHMHDPDSYEGVGCTDPALTNRCWVTVCQYRGKNAFGAIVLNQTRFIIGRSVDAPSLGDVIGTEQVR
jgi:hypothetical protein